MEKEQKIAIEILTMLRDFLSTRNVRIYNQKRDNHERGEGTGKTIYLGSDYYELEDEITDIIRWSNNAD